MSCCSLFDLDTHEPVLIAEDTKLENLRFLGQLMLSYSIYTQDIFKRFPNLQVLELASLRVGLGFESSNTSVATKWSWDFHFPLNLKQLRLYDFPLTSDALSTIARLPNLKELTLVHSIIQGGEWNMGEEDTFENLKILRLDEVTLTKWKVEDESFPEIPPRFGYICSLKVIKIVESPQLNDSAMKI
ncbi:hypothetical protein H5410_029571 [Solanum commersonii]|uniref:Uncharacterized protein n=1 Tax=Solanum commersonii TaxID=4109 RepID=A0A9J5YD33_SOLCO|nr:hypothetical protein H5410_029571 [Solanum commersonii]